MAFRCTLDRRFCVGGLRLMLALLLVGLTTAAAPVPLADRIDRIVQNGAARSAFWGIYVQDLTTGQVLYRLNADKTLMPASTQKLFTTATALDALGHDFRYETTLYFDGKVEGSVLKGDLIIQGSGDPTFGSRHMPGPDPLRTWAQALAQMGVTRLEGRIIGDDNAFADELYAEGWDVSYIATATYAQATSGLSYRDNLAQVSVRGTRSGRAANLQADPSGYLDLQNRVTTHGRRRGGSVRLDRVVGTETVTLHGAVSRSYRSTIDVPVHDPTAFTLHSFRRQLEAAGVRVATTLVDVDELRQKPDYQQAQPLMMHLSPPLSEIMANINKQSNNFYAEHVFRTFSWGGTTNGGERRAKALLARAGVDVSGLSIRDGSGLSRKDMITPEAMGRLLAFMHTHPDVATFKASLARGGEAGSTLRGRLKGQGVQAKTGSLQYVRALSGYATARNGHPLAFVVIANNYTTSPGTIKQTIDRIVRTLRG